MTYSEIKIGLDKCAADIASERARVTGGKNSITLANNNLAGYPAKYGPLVTAIDEYLAANPTDAAAQVCKAEMDALVAEFVALQSETAALVTAIGA